MSNNGKTHFTRPDEHPHAVLTDKAILFMEAGKPRAVEFAPFVGIAGLLNLAASWKIDTLWIQPSSQYGRWKAGELAEYEKNKRPVELAGWNCVPGFVPIGHENFLRTVSGRAGKTWITITWPEFAYEWHNKWNGPNSDITGKAMLAAIEYMGRAFNSRVHHNPGIIGRDLMERANQSERRAAWMKRSDVDFKKIPFARGDGFTFTVGIEEAEEYLAIWRQQHKGHKGKVYVHAWDINSQFPAACRYVELPAGKPDFAYEADNGDWLGALFRGLGVEMKKRPNGKSWDIPAGLYDVGPGFASKPRPYNQFFQEMNPLERSQQWVTSPMLKLLYQEEIPVTIWGAWVWPEKHILFDDFAVDFWKARQSLKDEQAYPFTAGRELAYYSAKQPGTKGIGLLSSPLTEQYKPAMYRPDFRQFIIDEAKAREYYNFKKVHELYGEKPLFVAADEAHYLSTEPEPEKAFPGCFTRPTELGGWKHKFTIEATPDVLACYNPNFSAGKTIVQLRRFQ